MRDNSDLDTVPVIRTRRQNTVLGFVVLLSRSTEKTGRKEEGEGWNEYERVADVLRLDGEVVDPGKLGI